MVRGASLLSMATTFPRRLPLVTTVSQKAFLKDLVPLSNPTKLDSAWRMIPLHRAVKHASQQGTRCSDESPKSMFHSIWKSEYIPYLSSRSDQSSNMWYEHYCIIMRRLKIPYIRFTRPTYARTEGATRLSKHKAIRAGSYQLFAIYKQSLNTRSNARCQQFSDSKIYANTTRGKWYIQSSSV